MSTTGIWESSDILHYLQNIPCISNQFLIKVTVFLEVCVAFVFSHASFDPDFMRFVSMTLQRMA